MTAIVLPSTSKGLDWLYPIFALIKNGVILTDSASKILYVNEAYQTATGYSATEIIGKNPGIMRSGYHDQNFYTTMWQTIKNAGIWEGEVWNRNKSGKVFPIALTIAKLQIENEIDPYYLGIFTDIMQTRAADAEKINLAFTDLLTKLPNRAAAEDYYARTIKALTRDQANVINKLGVIYVDMDDFKSINARYGYLMGDRVLSLFANKLDLLVRNVDFLARLESDHFVIIMLNPPTDEEFEQFCLRIYAEFSRPFVLEGENIHANCSIGIARLTDAAESLDELIKKAALVEK